jgi:hypothetical protein
MELPLRSYRRRFTLMMYAAPAITLAVLALVFSVTWLSWPGFWTDPDTPPMAKQFLLLNTISFTAVAIGMAGLGVAGRAVTKSSLPSSAPLRLSLASTVWLGSTAVLVPGVAYLFAGYHLAPAVKVVMFWIALRVHLTIARLVRARRPEPPSRPRPSQAWRAVIAALVVTAIGWGVVPAAGHAFPSGPAGEASPEAAVSEFLNALTANDRQRLLDLAYPGRTTRDADISADLDSLLDQLGEGTLAVTDTHVAFEAEGTMSFVLTGQVDATPFCPRVSARRLDPSPMAVIERPQRGYGRWFIQPESYRLHERSGSCPE